MSDYVNEICDYYVNGGMHVHCFIRPGIINGVDRIFHGEYKQWAVCGALINHEFLCDNKDITKEIKELVYDILNITDDEKMIIKIRFGIKCT